MSKIHILFVLALIGVPFQSTQLLGQGPTPLPLWKDGQVPDAVGSEEQDRPTITPYFVGDGKSNGASVVICPGGGYAVLATDHEGHQVAKWFNSIGVNAFVLKYRLGPRYHHPSPLHDVQRAIRWIRYSAQTSAPHFSGFSTNRIGVMGFSAGGHLASTAATHFDTGKADATDPIDRASSRPDFAILGYPVVSFSEPFGHAGSRKNLLGDNADAKLIESVSNEKQVTNQTPPTFMFHTAEDTGVPPDNSLTFFQALRKAGVPAELHVYQFGPHGVGLAHGDPVVFSWKERLGDWMKTNGFLADVERATVKGTINLNGKPLRWGSITLVPNGSPNQPVAWAMVNSGKFTIPKNRGAVVGVCRVEVRNLGSVEPRVTLEEVEVLGNSLVFDVKPGENTFDLNLP